MISAVVARANPIACICIRFWTSSRRDSARTVSQTTIPAGSIGRAATTYFQSTLGLAETAITDPTRTIR